MCLKVLIKITTLNDYDATITVCMNIELSGLVKAL